MCKRRVQAVDFTRPTKFSSDQERRIKRAMEIFCRTATSRLSAELRSQTLLFGHQRELEAALVFLPARLRLPAAELGAPPISLGPEPPTWTALAQHWPDVPVRKGFSQAFRFSTELANLPDLAVWYYGERHLGLITRQTDDGEFVIGAFVIK